MNRKIDIPYLTIGKANVRKEETIYQGSYFFGWYLYTGIYSNYRWLLRCPRIEIKEWGKRNERM